MNVFNKVTLEYLKKNRTRTIVTIVGIVLSVAMFCGVTTFASSIQHYLVEATIYDQGSWHGMADNSSYDNYEKIKNNGKAENTAYTQKLGYAAINGSKNKRKPYMYVLGASAGAENILPIHIISGKYPTNTNEILLPEHLESNGAVKYNIGDSLTLNLGSLEGYGEDSSPINKNDGDIDAEGFSKESINVRESRTYTVVGFYERPGIEPYPQPGYTAITAADQSPAHGYTYDIYFKMINPKETEDFMKTNGLKGKTNMDLLMYKGMSQMDSFNKVLYSFVAIVMGLIMFGAVALIYNAFSISVSERTKQFGLLSSIGATKKQMRHMVFSEALFVSAIGIPIGIICGIGGMWVTLRFVGDKFTEMGVPIALTMHISLISIVVAAVVGLITVLISAWVPSIRATKVTAVEAIRQNMDINTKGKAVKTSKLTYKLFGLPGVLASKHYKRSKKKYRTTVASLFMSVVLFVSASAFTEYLIYSVDMGQASQKYDLSFTIPNDDFNDEAKNTLLSDVKGAKSVVDASYSESYGTLIKIDNKYLTDKAIEALKVEDGAGADNSFRQLDTGITFIDDNSYKQLLKENGLSENEYMNVNNSLGIAIDGSMSFNQKSKRFERIKYFNSDKSEFVVRKYKKIDGYWCSGENQEDNGKKVVSYYKGDGINHIDTDDRIDLPVEEAYEEDVVFKLGKMIYERPYFISDAEMMIVYPMSLKNTIVSKLDKNYVSCDYRIRSDNHKASEEALKEMLVNKGIAIDKLYNIAEIDEQDRNMVTIIRVFAYGFIILISLISATNVFNTISTNISLRRREFAILKSVGMDNKSFNKMMNFECLLYGTKALLYGLPVSIGVTYLIWKSATSGFDLPFMLPWKAIGIATFSVFAVVFITMLYSMSKIKKDNTIDALKNENI